jgi:hypothetical protein
LKTEGTGSRFWTAVLLPRLEEFDYNQHRGSDGGRDDDESGRNEDDQSDNRSAPLFWENNNHLFS